MKIDPEVKKVSVLFPMEGLIRYQIPSYQRPYSWKNESIEQLFNDVVEEDAGYYAGNILVTGRDDMPDVIDGQQRLTTIILYFLVCGMILQDKFSTDKRSDGLLTDIKRRLYFDSEDEEFEIPSLALLPRDQEVYTSLLGGLFGKEVGKYGNRAFMKRYRFIYELIDQNFNTFEDLKSFYQKLLKVELLQVSVSDLGDAFSVFSSLNSKGQPLTLIDLLKGEFIKVGEQGNTSYEKTLKLWDELVAVLSGRSADADSAVVTQFLLNNYDAFENLSMTSVTKTKALGCYQKILKENCGVEQSYLETLLSRAKKYAEIVQIDGGQNTENELAPYFSDLVKLESTQVLPLLLYLFNDVEALDLDIMRQKRILEALKAFYVRRNIVLTPKSSNIRARIIGLIRAIDHEGLRGEAIVEKTLALLADISASDDQFRAALDQSIYDKNKKTARFVLIDIERNVGAGPCFDKGNPDSLDDYCGLGKKKSLKPRWSIEHILPEGDLPDVWRKEISPSDPEKADELQADYVHMFGNLTLTPYNSELGQKPFFTEVDPERRSKRDYKDPASASGRYAGLRSGLYLNSSIPDVQRGETIETKTHWTIEDIKRRNDWFADIIVNRYRLKDVGHP